MMMLAILLVALLTVSAANAAENATDDDISVEDNNAGTFADLASEIANATSELNLTRNYCYYNDSDYKEGIIINKSIVINGNGYTINGNNQSRALFIDEYCKNVILNNISFVNCSSMDQGGAVSWYGDYGTLSNCSFMNCSSKYGGAVYYGANGKLSGCSFVNCSADYKGGAIFSSTPFSEWIKPVVIFVDNSNFINCCASDGGAVYFSENDCRVIDSIFEGNIANGAGGGIYFAGENCSLIDSTFKGNIAQNGSEWYSEYPLKPTDNIPTLLSALDVNVTYNESVNLVATLKDVDGNPLQGEHIYIELNNVKYTLKTDSEGEVSLAIPTNLVPDTYIATISYNGNGKYGPSDNVACVGVNKMNTSIFACDVSFTYGDVGALVATLSDVNGNPICDADVVVVLNKVKYYLTTDSRGQVNLSLSNLPTGIYSSHIIFYGDDNYNPCDVTVRVNIQSLGTVIYARDVSVNYGDAAVLVATLSDVNGNPIEGADLGIYLDGVSYHLITDSKGQVNLSVTDLLYGHYVATISYSGNRNNYSYSNAYPRVSVKANIDISTVYDADAKELVATLTNSVNGNAIGGAEVQINLNGVKTTVKTNSKGQVKVSIADLSSDNYTAIISYRGKNIYNPTKITVKGSVKADMVISADYDSDNNVVVATLTDSNDGNTLANVSVKVSLNNVDYALTTDSKGQVNVSTSDLPPGTFTASFYAVNSKYNSVSTRITFNIKMVVVISAVYDSTNNEIVATLTNDAGRVLSNVNVKVIFNGVTSYVKTNSKGQVKVSAAHASLGTRTAKFFYAGNKMYKPVNVSISFVIKTKVIITDVYAYSNKLVATLTNGATGKPIVNAYMQVEINGVIYTVKSDSKSQISIDTSDLGLTAYHVTISYGGNSRYTPSSATVAINLNKANMKIKYKYDSEKKLLVATLKNSKTGKDIRSAYLEVDINGVKTIYKSDHTGHFVFSTADFAPGTHVGTITYGGNARYNSISAAFKVDV